MQAIIFANRHGNELSPLDEQYCPALLPVGNRALIEYTLEDVADAGITQVKLVISSHAEKIEAYLGDGSRWGVKIEYFLTKVQESVTQVMSRMKLDLNEETLVARGDILRSPCINCFVNYSKNIKLRLVRPKLADFNPGLLMLPAAQNHLHLLDWPLDNTTLCAEAITEILHGQCAMLDSFESYLYANLTIADASFYGLTASGRPSASIKPTKYFYLGAKTRTGLLSRLHAWGAIGEQTWIAPNVNMQNKIVIGNKCLIEKDCNLNDCLILDNSFVGEGLNIDNCIISQNVLINVGLKSAIKINDPRLISTSHKQIPHTESFLIRLISLLLLCLSLPLWPILFTWGVIHSWHGFIKMQLISNQNKLLNSWRFNIPYQCLALLPQLYHVCLGKLHLMGLSAKTEQSPYTAQEPSKHGVYGPVQLLAPYAIPEEEKIIIEQDFKTKNKRDQVRQLLKQNSRAVHSALGTQSIQAHIDSHSSKRN